MVFDPKFEGSIRFEQPVGGVAPVPENHSGLGAVAQIAQGLLGGVSFSQPETMTVDDYEYGQAVQIFGQEMGIGSDVSQWTPSQIRNFGAMFPQHADTALSTNEDFGGVGATAERSRRDTELEIRNEFATSEYGQIVTNLAQQMFPEDPESQAYFIEQKRLERAQAEADAAMLSRDADMATDLNTLDQRYWDVSENEIRTTVDSMAYDAAELVPQVFTAGGLNIEDIDPRLQQFLPNTITRITPDNVGRVMEYFRAGMVNQMKAQFSAEAGRAVSDPGEEYWNNVFGSYDAIIDAIETDPQAIADGLISQEWLRITQELQADGAIAGIAILNNLGQYPGVEKLLLQNSEVLGSLGTSLDEAVRGQRTVTVDDWDEIPRSQRPETLNALTGMLPSIASVPAREQTQGQRDVITGIISGIASGVEAQGITRIDDEVYQHLLNPNIIEAVNNGTYGAEAKEQLANAIMTDIQTDLDTLSQIGNMNDITLANSQLIYRGQDSEVQETVDSINNVFGMMDRAGVSDLLGSDLQTIFGEQVNTLQEEGLLPPGNREEITDSPTNRGGFEMMGGMPSSASLNMPEASSESREELLRYSGPTGEIQGGGEDIDTSSGVENYNPSFTSAVIQSLAVTESSGSFTTSNNEEGAGGRGHFGRLQFSRDRLAEASTALGVDITPEQFLNDPALQERVEVWHVNDYRRRLREDGLIDLVGQTIRGIPITESGLIAAAHLGGYRGMREFIESGGANDPSDVYGTSLMQYFAEHGGLTGVDLSQPPQYSPNATMVSEGVWANNGIFTMEGASSMTSPQAEEFMNNNTIPAFRRMQELFGGTVAINDAIARDGTSRETETPGSQHFQGAALDLDISGMSDQEKLRLVRAAHAAGFRGFGFGQGILHVDLGASRSWAYGNDTFGGLSVSEVQEMVATGDFGTDIPLASSEGAITPSEANLEQMRSIIAGAEPDFDPGEGAPTNFTVNEGQLTSGQQQQTESSRSSSDNRVEQQSDGFVTPEQSGRGQGQNNRQTLPMQQVDPEVQDLINALTERVSEEELEYLLNELREQTRGETRR